MSEKLKEGPFTKWKPGDKVLNLNYIQPANGYIDRWVLPPGNVVKLFELKQVDGDVEQWSFVYNNILYWAPHTLLQKDYPGAE